MSRSRELPRASGDARAASPFDLARDPLARRVAQGLSKLGLAMKTLGWQSATERGLTPTQAQALAFLARAGEAPRLSGVAEALGVTAATASEAVGALVRKELVTKSAAADDARAVALSLTAAGRREAARAFGWPDLLLEAVDTLSEEERVVLLKSLVKMIRSLQERGQIPVAKMCATCRFFRPNVHADAERPHHCAFVDAPFGDAHLRLDCPDHEEALAMT